MLVAIVLPFRSRARARFFAHEQQRVGRGRVHASGRDHQEWYVAKVRAHHPNQVLIADLQRPAGNRRGDRAAARHRGELHVESGAPKHAGLDRIEGRCCRIGGRRGDANDHQTLRVCERRCERRRKQREQEAEKPKRAQRLHGFAPVSGP